MKPQRYYKRGDGILVGHFNPPEPVLHTTLRRRFGPASQEPRTSYAPDHAPTNCLAIAKVDRATSPRASHQGNERVGDTARWPVMAGQTHDFV